MKQCNFYNGTAIFTLPENVCFCNAQFALFGRFSAASGSSVPFTLGLQRRSAKQRHIFKKHDNRTERTSAHEGTAALQQRQTDARATLHMTPTSMEVDSNTC